MSIVIDCDAFGRNLKVFRQRKGLTQKMLAELCGVGHVSICRYENGGALSNLYNAACIAKALDVSLDALVWGEADG